MSMSKKVRAVLTLSSRKQKDFAEYLGVSKQATSGKFSRDTFTAADLIKVADLCGCVLEFKLPDGTVIPFETSDLKRESD